MPFTQMASPATYYGILRKKKFNESDWMWVKLVGILKQKKITMPLYQQVWYETIILDMQTRYISGEIIQN